MATQTAIHNMMTDNYFSAVTASTQTTRITDSIDWDPGTGTVTLAGYMGEATTPYCYR